MTEAEQIRIANEKEQEELSIAYKRLFATDDGKKVLVDLTRFCGQDKTSVCESDPNPYQTFFVEGRRRVFLRIKSLMERKNERDT